jgi:hypothetical protein
MRRAFTPLLLIALVALRASGQQTTAGGMQHTAGMEHSTGMKHDAAPTMATQSGQAAFAAISEIVKILKADPSTDWSRVNLEALRQHLIDMDNVTMRSQVRQTPTPGGLVMTITGTPPVAAAIQRMVGMHAMMLSEGEGDGDAMVAKAARIPGGMRFTVTARDTADSQLVARIRGLGFIGLMTEGEHHPMHHMMVARGGMMMTH